MGSIPSRRTPDIALYRCTTPEGVDFRWSSHQLSSAPEPWGISSKGDWKYCGWASEILHHLGWLKLYNGINHLSTGAGFLPSIVSMELYWKHLSHEYPYPISFYWSLNKYSYYVL